MSEPLPASVAELFWEGLLILKTDGQLDDRYWDVDQPDGRVYLWFEGLYHQWAKEYRARSGQPAFNPQVMRRYLREEPGFEAMSKDHRMKGSVRSCAVFNLLKCPEELRQLVLTADEMVNVA